MNSAEVYKAAREVLAPWCRQNGFRRTSGGLLGWFKPVDGGFIVFWLQCNRDGWDAHAGSSFCVEFQVSRTPHVGGGGSEERHRLPHFLTSQELEDVRLRQNRIIARLGHAPEDHPFVRMGGDVAHYYRQNFIPVKKAYTDQSDIWLHYQNQGDVVMWTNFVLCRLPKIFTRLTILT